MRSELFVFGRFADDSQGVLAAVEWLTGVGVKLFCNVHLPCWTANTARGLKRRVTPDTNAQQCAVCVMLDYSQLAFRHENSLAPNACANEMAPVPGFQGISSSPAAEWVVGSYKIRTHYRRMARLDPAYYI